jgi:hypothetical protein
VPILFRHGGDPAHKISEVVRQIDVVPIFKTLPREVAVVAEGDLFHQVQP